MSHRRISRRLAQGCHRRLGWFSATATAEAQTKGQAIATTKSTAKSGDNSTNGHRAEWRGLATGKNDKGTTVTTEWGACIHENETVSVGDLVVLLPQRGDRLSFTVGTITDDRPVADKVRKETVKVRERDGSYTNVTETHHAYKVSLPTDEKDAGRLLARALVLVYGLAD